MKTRLEKDTLGEIAIPADKYWGPQSQRSLENFSIGNEKMPIEVIRAYAIVKRAAAVSNSQLGVLESKKADLISQVCQEILSGQLDEHFPLSVWQTGSGTQTNMNVNEVIVNRAHVLSGNALCEGSPLLSANDDVNKSQSSNDTFPTAMYIAGYSLLKQLTLPALEKLVDVFREKSIEFDAIVKIGRTHLMDATPITLGQEFSAFATQLDQGIAQLRQAMTSILPLALGGTAVGTGLNAPAGFAEQTIAIIARDTGYAFTQADNKFAALAAHDALVEVHGALQRIAVAMNKIASDIRLLGSGPRAGLGEIRLPANEPGSSIMPGKVNPTQSEAMIMVCCAIIGNNTTMTVAGAGGQLQLNTCKPVMINTLLQSARLLGDACQSFNEHCVSGISADTARLEQNLASSLMLVTALNPHIGYYKAAEIAQNAYANNLRLKEAALASGYVSADEFERWVKPANMTGATE